VILSAKQKLSGVIGKKGTPAKAISHQNIIPDDT
jgi:hypothetical protein